MHTKMNKLICVTPKTFSLTSFLTILSFTFLANAQISATINPSNLLSNPYNTCQLSVATNENPDGINTIPSYTIGQRISFLVNSSCNLNLYFFNVGADNSINLIPGLGNSIGGHGLILAGQIKSFPSSDQNFTISGPAGQDRILLLGSKQKLVPAQIAQFSSSLQYAVSNSVESNVELQVLGVAINEWTTAYTTYLVGAVPTVPVVVVPEAPTVSAPVVRLTPVSPPVTTVAPEPVTCIIRTLPDAQITINTTTYLALEGAYIAKFIPGTYLGL